MGLILAGWGAGEGEDFLGDRLPRAFKDDLQTPGRTCLPFLLQPRTVQRRIPRPSRGVPQPRRGCAARGPAHPCLRALRWGQPLSLWVEYLPPLYGGVASLDAVYCRYDGDRTGKAALDLQSSVSG